MPEKAASRRGVGLSRRLIVAAWSLGVPALLVVLIITRVFPVDGPGRVLYVVHDQVYLPMKGYLFTQFLPWSLALWGGLVLLIILKLVSYLVSGSLLKGLHQSLVLQLSGFPVWRAFLFESEKRLIRFRPASQTLVLAANIHRRKAMQARLKDRSRVHPAQAALFHINLLTLDWKTNFWHALLYCFEAWMVDKRPGSERDNRDATGLLRDRLVSLIEKKLRWRNESELEIALSLPPGFLEDSILIDLLFLAALEDRDLADRLLDPEIVARPTALNAAVENRLSLSCDTRQAMIQNARRYYENMTYDGYPDHSGDLTFLDSLPKASESLRAIGVLTTHIALERARLVGRSVWAEAYLEALESLNLAMAFAYEEKPIQRRDQQQVELKASSLFRDLPDGSHYRYCAELSAFEGRNLQETWNRAGLFSRQRGSLVSEDDFELERQRVRSLLLAAGPEEDQWPLGDGS